MAPTLYGLDASPPYRAVTLTAKALGVKLNIKIIDVLAREQFDPLFLKINPQHNVPTLVDGDLVINESRAICSYLINQYGPEDTLCPKDPKKMAHVNHMLFFDAGTLYKRFLDYFKPVMFDGAEPDTAKLESLKEALGWFNGYLEGQQYAAGHSLTVADLSLIAGVSTMAESGLDLSPWPNVHNWMLRAKALPYYEEANGSGAKQIGAFFKTKLELC